MTETPSESNLSDPDYDTWVESLSQGFPLGTTVRMPFAPDLDLLGAAQECLLTPTRENFLSLCDSLRATVHPMAAKYIYLTLNLCLNEPSGDCFALPSDSNLDAWYDAMTHGLSINQHFTHPFPWDAVTPEFGAQLKAFERIHLQLEINEVARRRQPYLIALIGGSQWRLDLGKLGRLLQAYEHPLHFQFAQMAYFVIHCGEPEHPTACDRWLVQMIEGLAWDPNFEMPCPAPLQ